MTDFHFLRPTLLYLLWIPAICVAGCIVGMYKRTRMRCIMPQMRPFLMSRGNVFREFVLRLSPVVGLGIGIVALAGPTWEKYPDALPLQSSVSLMVHLPETASRHEVSQLKMVVYQFLDSLQDETVSLSVQSGSIHCIVPYTRDYRLLRSYAGYLSPDIMPVSGDNWSGIETMVAPPVESDFHSVVYIAPRMTVEKENCWRELELPADYRTLLIPGSAVPDSVWNSIRHHKEEAMRVKALQDSTRWKDKGYLFCIPATLLFLPLFFRYRKSAFAVLALFTLSSCSYTGRMWNEAKVNFLLMRGDTLQAIHVSEDAFLRGMLWASAHAYGKAATEFAKDTTVEALYNRALVTCRGGRPVQALNLLKDVARRRPEWKFVSADMAYIERLLLSQGINPDTLQNNYGSEADDANSMEKDADTELHGDETELWADKLTGINPDDLNHTGIKGNDRSEALFRQIENNPKEFLKRRLKHEYENLQ